MVRFSATLEVLMNEYFLLVLPSPANSNLGPILRKKMALPIYLARPWPRI